VKLDIASGQIGDGKCGYHRLVSDVLQSLEFQVHLDLGFSSNRKEENADNREDMLYHTVN